MPSHAAAWARLRRRNGAGAELRCPLGEAPAKVRSRGRAAETLGEWENPPTTDVATQDNPGAKRSHRPRALNKASPPLLNHSARRSGGGAQAPVDRGPGYRSGDDKHPRERTRPGRPLTDEKPSWPRCAATGRPQAHRRTKGKTRIIRNAYCSSCLCCVGYALAALINSDVIWISISSEYSPALSK